jgi:NAD(P)-dependent dehydrogenase (short-subunit alcohol dehydrogenase family)
MDEAKALHGNVAVVTGGGRGIGAAIAKRLAEIDAAVAICGRSKEPLLQTSKSITAMGGRTVAVECDVTDYASVEKAAAQVTKELGRPTVLVNNAGVGAFSQPLHQMDLKEWDAVLNTNLRGVFYCIKAFAPAMIEAGGGHIINISSLAGKNALPKGAAYAASKWGLNGLSYSVAEELRGNNIRVSVVCPGSVDTELSPHDGKNKSKMLQPEDIAHAVAMLVTQAPQSFVSELLIRPTQKP